MRTDKAGNKIFKKMTIKVIFPDAILPDRTFVQHAPPQRGFGPEGIDQMLDHVADQLDSLYPWWQFRPTELVPVGSTIRFAFIFAGSNPNYVAPAPEIPSTTDSSTLGTETPVSDHTTAAIESAVGDTLQELASQACAPEEEK